MIGHQGMKAVLLLIGFILATGYFAEAQQPTKVPRIGYLTGTSLSANSARTDAFRQDLRELGYVEGKILSSSGDLQTGKRTGYLRSLPNSSV
jgi:hypothetical protein